MKRDRFVGILHLDGQLRRQQGNQIHCPPFAKTKGTSEALRRYAEVKASGEDAGVGESTLNMLGYTLLQDGQTQDAIAVFQRNVHEYPQSGNVYDSLGEAYLKAGQKDMAITNYQKSLQLDPKNQNAVEVLRKLKSDK